MERALEEANTLHDTLWYEAGRFRVTTEQYYFGVEAPGDEDGPVNAGLTITLNNTNCEVLLDMVPTAQVREMLLRLHPWFRHYGRTPIVELDRIDGAITVVDNYKYDDAGVRLPDQTGIGDDDLEAGEEVYAHIVRMPLPEFVALGNFPGPDPEFSLSFCAKQNESNARRDLEFNVYYFLPKLIANVSEVAVPLFFSWFGSYVIPKEVDRADVVEEICHCLGPYENPLIEVGMATSKMTLSRKKITVFNVTETIMFSLLTLAKKVGIIRGIVLTDNNHITIFGGRPPDSSPVQHVFSNIAELRTTVLNSDTPLHFHLHFPPVLDEEQKRHVANDAYNLDEQTGRKDFRVIFNVKRHQVANGSSISQRLERRRLTGQFHLPTAVRRFPVTSEAAVAPSPEAAAAPSSEAAAAPSWGGRTSRRPRSRSIKKRSINRRAAFRK